MISYIIDVRTSITLCVMISIISHLFTSDTKGNGWIFRRVKRSVIKYYFLSLQELAFTIRGNIVPISNILGMLVSIVYM